jgi:hypothetical protein
VGWQVTPGTASAITIKHGLDKQAVIHGRHTDPAWSTWQKILDPVPLVIAKAVAAHWSAPRKLTAYESKNALRRNPPRFHLQDFAFWCCILDSPTHAAVVIDDRPWSESASKRRSAEPLRRINVKRLF